MAKAGDRLVVLLDIEKVLGGAVSHAAAAVSAAGAAG
jgi:hypothetical protein